MQSSNIKSGLEKLLRSGALLEVVQIEAALIRHIILDVLDLLQKKKIRNNFTSSGKERERDIYVKEN